MLRVWRIIKPLIPIILEIFGEIDIQAIKTASDKKSELKRQLKEIFDL